jgi:hypothetical protein
MPMAMKMEINRAPHNRIQFNKLASINPSSEGVVLLMIAPHAKAVK